MHRVSPTEILKTAKKLNNYGKKWHFHILTPGCDFNKDKRFALILENTSDNEQFVHFSLKKPLETGKKLVEILYGKGISKNKKVSSKGEGKDNLTQNVKQMIKTATELNLKGFSWHHHTLFPDCIYNKSRQMGFNA